MLETDALTGVRRFIENAHDEAINCDAPARHFALEKAPKKEKI
jgi:hypothetical protein